LGVTEKSAVPDGALVPVPLSATEPVELAEATVRVPVSAIVVIATGV
jgi:hypothetical protein